ncbi:MAG: hypothetical protein V4754_02875 [Pseudomonadota bacterium]
MNTKAIVSGGRGGPPGRGQRGAALLILVAVIGVGMASVLVSALGKRNLEGAREQRTLAAMAQAKEALIGFAVLNGRLPRPARSALDGRESPAPCRAAPACTGFVPWVTLGVTATDSWGKLLRYSVTPGFTQAPIMRGAVLADKTVRTRDPSGALQYVMGAPGCPPGACVPLVLYSNGRDNFGTSGAGRRQANAANGNLDEAGNDSSALHFISRPASADPAGAGGSFDDLVDWIPQGILFARLAASGKLP